MSFGGFGARRGVSGSYGLGTVMVPPEQQCVDMGGELMDHNVGSDGTMLRYQGARGTLTTSAAPGTPYQVCHFSVGGKTSACEVGALASGGCVPDHVTVDGVPATQLPAGWEAARDACLAKNKETAPGSAAFYVYDILSGQCQPRFSGALEPPAPEPETTPNGEKRNLFPIVAGTLVLLAGVGFVVATLAIDGRPGRQNAT